MSTENERIAEIVRSCEREILETYQYLHSIPEGPFAEHQTAAYIANKLAASGMRVQSGVGRTGVVATSERQSEPIIALRAAMDALEYEVNGTRAWIHACGHDAQSAMVLWSGQILSRHYPKAAQHLKLIFQPAEETGLGAKTMIEAGAVDDVSVLVGIHLRPASECPLGKATAALYHSASVTARYKVVGKRAHSGRPHLGVSAADAVAAATLAVNAIKPDPRSCATINVVGLAAGNGRAGTIPDSGMLVVNVRAESNDLASELLQRVDVVVSTAVSVNGALAERVSVKYIPAAVYESDTVSRVNRAIAAVLGESGLIDRISTPGAEDFHVYRYERPSLRTAYIGLGADLVPDLHDPKSSFNLKALGLGVEILATSVVILSENPTLDGG